MADVVLLAKQAPGPEKAEKACPWYAGGCHGEGSAPCIYPGNTEVNMSPLIPPPPLQRTVAWHPPLKKISFAFKAPSSPRPFPSPSSSSFPARPQAAPCSGGQAEIDTRAASSLLRHILATSRRCHARTKGKANAQIPIAPSITLTTYMEIQGVEAILKLPLTQRGYGIMTTSSALHAWSPHHPVSGSGVAAAADLQRG